MKGEWEGQRRGGRWAGKGDRTERREEEAWRKCMFYIFICNYDFIYLSIIYRNT